jgi:hypothetical protein
MPDFKPSQVFLAPIPLCGTMGHAEREFAAALIIRACQVNGDAWHPVAAEELGMMLKAALDVGAEAGDRWLLEFLSNPFIKYDFYELVEHGYAKWTDEPGKAAELTDKAFEAMRYWVKPAAPDTAKEGRKP